MAIFVVIAYTLLPFVSVVPMGDELLIFGPRFLPYNGSIFALVGPNGEAPLYFILITIFLSVFSGFSAIGAVFGIREARAATLLFITLNVVWWMGLVIYAFIAVSEPNFKIQMIGQMIFPPLWLAMVWWNYTRREITDYYDFVDSKEN